MVPIVLAAAASNRNSKSSILEMLKFGKVWCRAFRKSATCAHFKIGIRKRRRNISRQMSGCSSQHLNHCEWQTQFSELKDWQTLAKTKQCWSKAETYNNSNKLRKNQKKRKRVKTQRKPGHHHDNQPVMKSLSKAQRRSVCHLTRSMDFSNRLPSYTSNKSKVG